MILKNIGGFMNREDFKMLEGNLVYLDSAATSLKPKCLTQKIGEYYNEYTANYHRGDYKLSLKVDDEINGVRHKLKEFINAKSADEIVFTKNTTDSLNIIVGGYFKYHLKAGDHILLDKAEHASNILPWFELASSLDIKIDYASLDSQHRLTLSNIKESITDKTKVISLAYVTNVIGDIRDLKEIISYAHQKDILVVVDGAQALGHLDVDVQKLDIDFLTFSAHKMCGPTGVGILYGREYLLRATYPISYGGGMNASFDSTLEYEYKDIPYKLESGTINIADIIGYGAVIDYLKKIGINNIHKYEKELKKYALSKLSQLKDIIIYSTDDPSGIISFNIKDIFAQDLAIYLDKYNVCVRAGNHCAKLLKDEIGVKNTVRISLYFYNTKKEIDYLFNLLNVDNLKSLMI